MSRDASTLQLEHKVLCPVVVIGSRQREDMKTTLSVRILTRHKALTDFWLAGCDAQRDFLKPICHALDWILKRLVTLTSLVWMS